VVAVSDLNKNIGGSADVVEKRYGSEDLHSPIHPLLDIGLKDSRHFVIYSEVKPKPIVTRSPTFSRALRQLQFGSLDCLGPL